MSMGERTPQAIADNGSEDPANGHGLPTVSTVLVWRVLVLGKFRGKEAMPWTAGQA